MGDGYIDKSIATESHDVSTKHHEVNNEVHDPGYCEIAHVDILTGPVDIPEIHIEKRPEKNTSSTGTAEHGLGLTRSRTDGATSEENGKSSSRHIFSTFEMGIEDTVVRYSTAGTKKLDHFHPGEFAEEGKSHSHRNDVTNILCVTTFPDHTIFDRSEDAKKTTEDNHIPTETYNHRGEFDGSIFLLHKGEEHDSLNNKCSHASHLVNGAADHTNTHDCNLSDSSFVPEHALVDIADESCDPTLGSHLHNDTIIVRGKFDEEIDGTGVVRHTSDETSHAETIPNSDGIAPDAHTGGFTFYSDETLTGNTEEAKVSSAGSHIVLNIEVARGILDGTILGTPSHLRHSSNGPATMAEHDYIIKSVTDITTLDLTGVFEDARCSAFVSRNCSTG